MLDTARGGALMMRAHGCRAEVNVPIVELRVRKPFFGLHRHVQYAWSGFGRHDAKMKKSKIKLELSLDMIVSLQVPNNQYV